MTEPDFPLSILGLIHTENQINQIRPVLSDELVTTVVRARNVRAHPAGIQIDLASEAFVGDELVWFETSTYLRRQHPARSKTSEPKTGREEAEQSELSAIARWQIPANIGRKYAAVSGDRNPIHLYSLTAKAFGFPKAIAHGMWLKARVLAVFEGRLPPSLSVWVRFSRAVLLPSLVELSSGRDGPSATRFELSQASKGRSHLTGVFSSYPDRSD
jgi:acyl dehydratase